MRRFRALGSLLLLSAFAVSAQELAWKEFRSAEDGFSVLFPGTPKVTEEKLKGFVKRYFTVQNGRRFKVTITDVGQPIPQNVVERVMNVARDGLASSVEGKVSDERAVKCGQHP